MSSPGSTNPRVLIVQYAGDYREAYQRMMATGAETYYGHRYVLDVLARLAALYGDAGVLCARSAERYSERLPTGVTVIGAAADPKAQTRSVLELAEAFDPTHLVVAGPLTPVMRWGIRTRRRVIGIFADSFETSLARNLWRFGRLASLMRDRRVEWVANHGLNACLSLQKFGCPPDKIIPWDWPHLRQPNETPAKAGPPPAPHTLVYVGSVTRTKGIGDVIAALPLLKQRGLDVRLKVAGAGDVEVFREQARQLGVSDRVDFLGLVPNTSVLQLMKDSAAVVVPSQHAYPEGLPLTIYEALCSRTPIIASDHPMFAGRLVHGQSALIFPAGDVGALANRIAELLGNAALYASLSGSAQQTWQSIQIPVKWGDLIEHWLRDHAEDRQWLAEHRLRSGRYRLG